MVQNLVNLICIKQILKEKLFCTLVYQGDRVTVTFVSWERFLVQKVSALCLSNSTRCRHRFSSERGNHSVRSCWSQLLKLVEATQPRF